MQGQEDPADETGKSSLMEVCMKKIFFLIFSLLFTTSIAFSDTPSDQTSAAAQKARQDYRAYLEELKALNRQYKEITAQTAKIIKEEGVPQWDEATDSLVIGDAGWVPSIKQTDTEMVVSVDLPGLQRESIKVSVVDGLFLKINAARKNSSSPVEKQIKLPLAAEGNDARAAYEDGVLTVTLRKAPPSKKEIEVPVR